jgi:hypothetical protein
VPGSNLKGRPDAIKLFFSTVSIAHHHQKAEVSSFNKFCFQYNTQIQV